MQAGVGVSVVEDALVGVVSGEVDSTVGTSCTGLFKLLCARSSVSPTMPSLPSLLSSSLPVPPFTSL